MWDVKAPTHYSKRVGCEVPGVVAVLCVVLSLQQGLMQSFIFSSEYLPRLKVQCVKEPTHYSKRVGREVPGVVAVLCVVLSLQQGIMQSFIFSSECWT